MKAEPSTLEVQLLDSGEILGTLSKMEQMLLGWHASAERMLQSGWFDKSLEECLTFCVLKYHCWYLADQSLMLAFKPW